jgi:hypothetical protein
VFSVSADAFILGCGRNLFPSPPPPPPPTQKKREVGKRRTFLYSQSFRLDSFFFSFLFLPATTTRTHATEWPIQRPTRITSIDFDFLTFPLWIVKKIFNPPPFFFFKKKTKQKYVKNVFKKILVPDGPININSSSCLLC